MRLKPKVSPVRVNTLIAELAGPTWEKQSTAFRELVEIGQQAVPSLIEALRSSSPVSRRFSAAVLGQIGEAALAASDDLRTAMRDSCPMCRVCAAWAVTKMGRHSDGALAVLCEALKDDDHEVQMVALSALGDLGPGAAPAAGAMTQFLADANVEKRAAAAWGLGQIGPQAVGAVERLVRLLQDKDAGVREQAIVALGYVGPGAAIAVIPLAAVLRQDDPWLRLMAVRALRDIGQPSAKVIEPLVEALSDADYRVRLTAAWALSETRSTKAIEPLVTVLRDENHEVRVNAAVSLGELGAKEAVPSLVEALADKVAHVAKAAAYALGLIGPEALQAAPALVRLLQGQYPEGRVEAAIALGKIKATAHVATLESALRDRDPEVRRAACQSMKELGAAGREVFDAAMRALSAVRDGDTSGLLRAQAHGYMVDLLAKSTADRSPARGIPVPDLVIESNSRSAEPMPAGGFAENHLKLRVAHLALRICREQGTDTFSCVTLAAALKQKCGVGRTSRSVNNYLEDVEKLFRHQFSDPQLNLFGRAPRQGCWILPIEGKRQEAWSIVESMFGPLDASLAEQAASRVDN